MENETRLNLKPLLLICGIVIFLMFMLTTWAWFHIPADQKIPVHWGIDGKVDGYGSKFEGLFLMPLITCGLVILFAFLPYIEPRKLNLTQSKKAYTAIIFSLLGLMSAMHIIMVFSGLGYQIAVDRLIPTAIGILFVVIGNYMGKVRSNFFMGIRTPWTLSSELSWSKTHRLGGRLFVLQGFIMILVASLGYPRFSFIIIIAGAILLVLVTFIYSYIVWKNDPNKQSTGR